MIDVKRTFFLTDEETEQFQKITGDKYILKGMPHYELSDGTVMYARGGTSDYAIEVHYGQPSTKKSGGE